MITLRTFLTSLFFLSITFFVVIADFVLPKFHSPIITFCALIIFFQMMLLKRYELWQLLYLFSIIVFLCLNDLFYSLGLMNLSSNMSFSTSYYKYSSESFTKAKVFLIYFLSGTYFAILFLLNKKNKIKESSYKFTYLKGFQFFFIFLFFVLVVDKFSLYLRSKTVGYVQTFHSEYETLDFFIVADILYPVIFSILTIGFFEKKISKIKAISYTVMFLLPFTITFFAGFRGEFVGKFLALTMIFYASKNFSKVYFFLFFSILVFAGLAIEFIRFDDSLSIFSLPLSSYLEAFSYLGNTFHVIPLTIDFQEELYHGWKYFFGGPIGVFSLSPTYSFEGIQSKPYLPQHLTYLIDYYRFKNGSTIGGSIVSEIILISSYLIMPISFLVIIISKIIIDKSIKSFFWFYVALTFFENFLLIPRGGFLKFIDKEFIIGLATILLINILHNLSKSNKVNV